MAVARASVQRYGDRRRVRGVDRDGATSPTSPTRWTARVLRSAERDATGGSLEASEDPRTRDHGGLLGMIERHLDDVELIERVRWVRGVCAVLAPGQFRLRPRILLSRHVEVDDLGVRRAWDERVRV